MNLSTRIDQALEELEERPPGDWRDGASGFGGGLDPDLLADPQALVRLANMRMPFGKYAGRLLLDLPEAYVLWFANKGYPKGELGASLAAMNEIKANGMEALLRPLVEGALRPGVPKPSEPRPSDR
jgi:hypothetical protein